LFHDLTFVEDKDLVFDLSLSRSDDKFDLRASKESTNGDSGTSTPKSANKGEKSNSKEKEKEREKSEKEQFQLVILSSTHLVRYAKFQLHWTQNIQIYFFLIRLGEMQK
jgi:hypothetical protein